MADNAATAEVLGKVQPGSGSPMANAPAMPLDFGCTTTDRIEDVEAIWRRFSAAGVLSPGQDYDFVKLWVSARGVSPADQLYIVGSLDGTPLALLPLHRTARGGIRVLSWFPGTHVGCNAPLVDQARLAALSAVRQAEFWRRLFGSLRGADLVYLRAVPLGPDQVFAALGDQTQVEILYRSQFDNWEACNGTQRSKSRRKHDRQQGEKLDALGRVSFGTIEPGDPSAPMVLETMFRQRAARFAEMGIKDPFAASDVLRFYQQTVQPGSGVAIKLHVLRLDEDIVAVRYNVVFGEKLFCLISSMSVDPKIQGGSPGKQCLLRVMQSVFDEGFRTFDMGAGFTDEKRHWCNVQIELAHYYFPLSLRGRVVVAGHRFWQSSRARIKADPRLAKLAKAIRARLQRTPPKSVAASDEPSD